MKDYYGSPIHCEVNSANLHINNRARESEQEEENKEEEQKKKRNMARANMMGWAMLLVVVMALYVGKVVLIMVC
ncbi:hypothetical protein C5167_017298 [Papaver somniferum]|uniref:Transmembrane protein n=1 Tax=Papaver somniferum TaxID=3469 RepID=A0A4Y7IJ13_PAPSO|nr:hypothetical protein C5167_017298 [Papaver somniferum]